MLVPTLCRRCGLYAVDRMARRRATALCAAQPPGAARALARAGPVRRLDSTPHDWRMFFHAQCTERPLCAHLGASG
eukprot:5137410-Prymnesium_polylepis.1